MGILLHCWGKFENQQDIHYKMILEGHVLIHLSIKLWTRMIILPIFISILPSKECYNIIINILNICDVAHLWNTFFLTKNRRKTFKSFILNSTWWSISVGYLLCSMNQRCIRLYASYWAIKNFIFKWKKEVIYQGSIQRILVFIITIPNISIQI